MLTQLSCTFRPVGSIGRNQCGTVVLPKALPDDPAKLAMYLRYIVGQSHQCAGKSERNLMLTQLTRTFWPVGSIGRIQCGTVDLPKALHDEPANFAMYLRY